MALTWALFALALAGWLAVTAVIWTVLYTETKRRLDPVTLRGDGHRDETEESGDSLA